jgi:hypothetical protein
MLRIDHTPATDLGTRDISWGTNDYIPEMTPFLPQPNPVLNDGSSYTILGADTDDQDIDHGSNVTSLVIDLTPVGLAAAVDMWDNGSGDDAVAYDGVFTLNITIPFNHPPGTYYLNLTATDNGTNPGPLQNSSANISLIVAQHNRAPVLRASPPTSVDAVEDGPDENVLVNETVFYDIDIDEGYVDSMSFDVHNGTDWTTHHSDENITIDVRTDGNVSFNFSEHKHGQWEFMFRGMDSKGLFITHNITVTVTPVNDPPVMNSTSMLDTKKTAYQDEWLNATYEGWDEHDGEPVTFSAELIGPIAELPAGFTFHTNGTLEFLPTNIDVGIFYVNISVTDPADAYDWINVTIEVINENDPPVLLKVNGIDVTEDVIVIEALEDEYTNFTVEADDPDLLHSEELNFSTDILNPRFSIVGETGNCSFLPENDDVGFINGTIIVRDQQDEKVNASISLHVINVNDPPEAQDIEYQINDTDSSTPEIENLSVTFSTDPALDVDIGDTLTYIWNFDDGTTEESGVDLLSVVHLFPAEGTYNVTLTVQDVEKAVNATTVQITVLDAVKGSSDYSYKTEDLERSYTDPSEDVASYTKAGDSVTGEVGEENGIDLTNLDCSQDGNYLKIEVKFSAPLDSESSIYIYFVKSDHEEKPLLGKVSTLPSSYAPSPTKYLYSLKSNSVSYTNGELTSSGLRYEVKAESGALTFSVLLADMEKEGEIQTDFELFAIAEISNGTYYARDTIGAGAADPPDMENVEPDDDDEDDKGMFGLGKFQGIDIFWLIVAGAALVLIIIIIIVILVVRKRKKDEEAAEAERVRYFATPGHAGAEAGGGAAAEEDDRYKVTYDMYEDTFEPPSPMLPGSQPSAQSPFDISNLLEQDQQPLGGPAVGPQPAAPIPAVTDLPPMDAVPEMTPPPIVPEPEPQALLEPSTSTEEEAHQEVPQVEEAPEMSAPEVTPEEEKTEEAPMAEPELQPVEEAPAEEGVQELQPLEETEPAEAPDVTPVEPVKVNCYSCSGEFEVTTTERPVLLKCPHCGVESQLA